MAVADDGLAGTMRPQRWVVEVPRSRDMSKDAVLLALAEGAEMGPFAELALVAVVSTVPLKHGKGGAEVPQSKADPSALAAEQRRVEDSVLRPFLTLAATKEVRAFAHVECCDSNKTGLCRAVQRFQAAKLFLNTRKNFSLLQRSSSSLTFFESHLPRGVTILVVKGGKKVSESLSTGERVETTRDYLLTQSFTIKEDDDDSDTNSVGSARSTRSAPMALQSSDRRMGRVASDNSVNMFAATTVGGSMRHGVQASSSASNTSRSSMVGDGGGDGSSANPFQRFRKGFGSMGAQSSLGVVSSNTRRTSFEREQQPHLAFANVASAGAAAARLSGMDSDDGGSSRLSSGQLYSVDFPWAGSSDDGRSLDGSVHGAHSRNPSSISGGGGGVSREIPLLGGGAERGVGNSGTSIPSGPGWPSFASASGVSGGSNRDPNGAISAESSAHGGSVFEKFGDATSPRPCPPDTEDSSVPTRSAAVAAVGAGEAGGGAVMGTGPPPRPPKNLSPASSSFDLRSPSLTPSSSFRVGRGIAMDSPERPPIPRPPSGSAAALSPVLNVEASAAAADGEAGMQAALLAEISKLRAATAAAQQAAAAAEQEAQRAKEESLRLVSQLPGASAGSPLAAAAAAAAAAPLHLPSPNVSRRRTLKEELEMELAELNGEDGLSVSGYGMGLDMSNLNVRVRPSRTDSLTSLSAIAPASGTTGGSMRYSRATAGILPDMEGEDDDVTCSIRMPLDTIDSGSSGIKRGAAAAFAGSSSTLSAAAVGSIAAPFSYTQGTAVVGTTVPSSSDGSRSDEVGLSLMGAECRHFSAAELLVATNDFSAKNLLGRGSYGPVYRGELHGCAVAVKRREKRKGAAAAAGAASLGGEVGGGGGNLGMEPAESLEFRTEVEVLSRLRHPHIVLLMGHCPEDASIVYEYLPGGNLQDRLHPGSSSSGDKQVVRGGGSVAVATPSAATRPPLLWPDRFRIAAEITSALLFLHRYDPPIIHRDLKPDNILLDANDLSKISDVGLARLLPKEKCEVLMKVQGTIGFIDPEVLQTGEISVKVDVYSLGLILILLVTSFTSVKQIHNILKDCSPDDNGSASAGAADESGAASPTRDEVKAVAALLQHLDASAGDWPRNLAAEILRTAVRCIERCSALRPDLGTEVQPGCAAIAKAAREERERRLASADAKFFCPLSKERMQDPVVAADGFTYERKHIERWLETSIVSPLSGEPLAHKCLAPNRTLHELMLSSV